MIGSILTLCLLSTHTVPDSLLARFEEPWLAPGYSMEELFSVNPRDLGDPFPEAPSPIPLFSATPHFYTDSSGDHLRLAIGTSREILRLEDGRVEASITLPGMEQIYRVSFSRDALYAAVVPLPWSDQPFWVADTWVGDCCPWYPPEGMEGCYVDIDELSFLLLQSWQCAFLEPWTGARVMLPYESVAQIARASRGNLCCFVMCEGEEGSEIRWVTTDGDGNQLWEKRLTNRRGVSPVITPDGELVVAILHSGAIEVCDGDTGEALWSMDGSFFDASLMTSDDGGRACIAYDTRETIPDEPGTAESCVMCLSLRPEIQVLWNTAMDTRSVGGTWVQAVSDDGRCLVSFDGGPDRPFMNGFLLLDGDGMPIWSSGNIQPDPERIFDLTTGSFLFDRSPHGLYGDLLFYSDREACRLLGIARALQQGQVHTPTWTPPTPLQAAS